MKNQNKFNLRFNTLLESTIGNSKPLISEQTPPQGYKDITQWFTTPEGKLYIPDGKYVVDGMGYNGNIMTSDNKDTGYAFYTSEGKRGALPKDITISQSGGDLTYELKITNIYLNDQILNSSGLKTN
jgi:hypothetical protein